MTTFSSRATVYYIRIEARGSAKRWGHQVQG